MQSKFFLKKARKKYIVNKSNESHKKYTQLEEPHDRFGPVKKELGKAFQEEVSCQLVLKGRIGFSPGNKGVKEVARGKGGGSGQRMHQGQRRREGKEVAWRGRREEHAVAGVGRAGLDSGAVSRAHHGGLEPRVRGPTLCCSPDTLKLGWLGNSTWSLLKSRYCA